jgi:hypothetical protein
MHAHTMIMVHSKRINPASMLYSTRNNAVQHRCSEAAVETRKMNDDGVWLRDPPAIKCHAVGVSGSLKVVLVVHHELGELALECLPGQTEPVSFRVPARSCGTHA